MSLHYNIRQCSTQITRMQKKKKKRALHYKVGATGHRRMTLFPIFVAACEVCCYEVNKQNHIWREATAVSIKSLASCCPPS